MLEWTWEQCQWRGTLHSPKLQHYWNLTIRLFSVISRTFVESYSSAEMQSVYSAALADRAKWELKLFQSVRHHFYSLLFQWIILFLVSVFIIFLYNDLFICHLCCFCLNVSTTVPFWAVFKCLSYLVTCWECQMESFILIYRIFLVAFIWYCFVYLVNDFEPWMCITFFKRFIFHYSSMFIILILFKVSLYDLSFQYLSRSYNFLFFKLWL